VSETVLSVINPLGTRLRDAFSAYQAGELSAPDYVRFLYGTLLQRDVDPPSLAHYLEMPDLSGLAYGILTSHEYITRWKNASMPMTRGPACKRVLLFGAYGNGNLGDRIQADVLRRLARLLRPELEVWACSALSANFVYPFERVLPSSELAGPALNERFDLLIVGGGGLLAHPHDPLRDREWQRSLELPVALLGIGARAPFAGDSEVLIRKAYATSGRDRTSIAVLGEYRDDVTFAPDPVLSDPALERTAVPSACRDRILWILQADLIKQCGSLLDQINPDLDTVCFLEPHIDAVMLLRWPHAVAVHSSEELIALVDAADGVVSTRYHGAIFAILRGKPVYGVCKDKTRELLERYGAAHAFSEDGAGFARAGSFALVPQKQMRQERMVFMAQFAELLERA
jgi:hypothetical protein